MSNQIATTSRLLNSYRLFCEKEKSSIEQLYNEQIRIANLITQFKSNNEEYLKIKQTAEEKVKDVLTNGKLILNFATASVIQSLRRNPELCNFVLNDISNNTTPISCGSSSLVNRKAATDHLY